MSYDWLESSIYETLPSNAVWCCKNKQGLDIFIGKYSLDKSVLGVKIVPQLKEAFTSSDGKEIPVLNYKILVSNGKEYHIWVRVTDGRLPSNAVQCGQDKKNNKFLVGRTFHKGYLIPGYVHSITKVIHISHKGKEYKYSDYEVLIDS